MIICLKEYGFLISIIVSTPKVSLFFKDCLPNMQMVAYYHPIFIICFSE